MIKEGKFLVVLALCILGQGWKSKFKNSIKEVRVKDVRY